MSKPTPGPWRIGRHLGSPSEVRLIHKDVGDKGQGIPIIEGVVSIEDARLIAAAPELLEALKKLSDAYTRMKPLGYPLSDTERLAKAVIAKAEGR